VPVFVLSATYQMPRRHRGENFSDSTLVGLGETDLAFRKSTAAWFLQIRSMRPERRST